MKFRKKPVVIEAFQLDGQNIQMGWEDVPEWFTSDKWYQSYKDVDAVYIKTLEGDMKASPGDWIIQGVKGEIYPCKPDIFEHTYEPVNE